MRRLGVLGGTFDPVHVGHLIAASEALHAFDLDRILFVPAGDPWQKTGPSAAEDRFMMTSLATGLHRSFATSRIEVDRKGPSYSVDTMHELAAFYPDLQLFLIVGSDAAAGLATWHNIEKLREVAEVISVTRRGTDLPGPAGEGMPQIHHLEIPSVDVSSTDIRSRVRTGAPIDFLVPINVAEYIKERGLYVGGSESAS